MQHTWKVHAALILSFVRLALQYMVHGTSCTYPFLCSSCSLLSFSFLLFHFFLSCLTISISWFLFLNHLKRNAVMLNTSCYTSHITSIAQSIQTSFCWFSCSCCSSYCLASSNCLLSRDDRLAVSFFFASSWQNKWIICDQENNTSHGEL